MWVVRAPTYKTPFGVCFHVITRCFYILIVSSITNQTHPTRIEPSPRTSRSTVQLPIIVRTQTQSPVRSVVDDGDSASRNATSKSRRVCDVFKFLAHSSAARLRFDRARKWASARATIVFKIIVCYGSFGEGSRCLLLGSWFTEVRASTITCTTYGFSGNLSK